MTNTAQTLPNSHQFEVLDAFELAGRGTVVVLKHFTALVPGSGSAVLVSPPDAPPFQATAFQEYLLRASERPEESALLLLGIKRTQIPTGSYIKVPIPLSSVTKVIP